MSTSRAISAAQVVDTLSNACTSDETLNRKLLDEAARVERYAGYASAAERQKLVGSLAQMEAMLAPRLCSTTAANSLAPATPIDESETENLKSALLSLLASTKSMVALPSEFVATARTLRTCYLLLLCLGDAASLHRGAVGSDARDEIGGALRELRLLLLRSKQLKSASKPISLLILEVRACSCNTATHRSAALTGRTHSRTRNTTRRSAHTGRAHSHTARRAHRLRSRAHARSARSCRRSSSAC